MTQVLSSAQNDLSIAVPMTCIPDYDIKHRAAKPVLETSWHREDHWREQVTAWKASGLQIDDYCKANNIPVFQLYYWQRKFDHA